MDPFVRDMRAVEQYLGEKMREAEIMKATKHLIEHLQYVNQQKTAIIQDLEKRLVAKDRIIARWSEADKHSANKRKRVIDADNPTFSEGEW